MSQNLLEQKLHKDVHVQVFMSLEADLLKEQRQALRAWLQETLTGQQIQHPALAKPISLNWQGLKHSLSTTSTEPQKQFHALRHLPHLLRQATYSHYEPDSHTPPRKGVGIYILYADCHLADEAYRVWLRVRETPDGLYFYDLGIVR